jgi:hypothetical protein
MINRISLFAYFASTATSLVNIRCRRFKHKPLPFRADVAGHRLGIVCIAIQTLPIDPPGDISTIRKGVTVIL